MIYASLISAISAETLLGVVDVASEVGVGVGVEVEMVRLQILSG